jgi:hypothetical protein
MKYTIAPDRSTLTLECTQEEQAELRERRETEDCFGTQLQESETLEPLIANSELTWIDPADTGDLTSAPMLGILGPEVPGCETAGLNPQPLGWIFCGQYWGENHTLRGTVPPKWFQPITARWAFMDYQVRSFLTDLADTGKAVFVS